MRTVVPVVSWLAATNRLPGFRVRRRERAQRGLHDCEDFFDRASLRPVATLLIEHRLKRDAFDPLEQHARDLPVADAHPSLAEDAGHAGLVGGERTEQRRDPPKAIAKAREAVGRERSQPVEAFERRLARAVGGDRAVHHAQPVAGDELFDDEAAVDLGSEQAENVDFGDGQLGRVFASFRHWRTVNIGFGINLFHGWVGHAVHPYGSGYAYTRPLLRSGGRSFNCRA